MDFSIYNKEIEDNGFAIIPKVYTEAEITAIGEIISSNNNHNPNFRKSAGLFAIRQLFKETPQVVPVIINKDLNALVKQLFGPEYFIVKSIYFDKPGNSNWFVAYHQDLTISVLQKIETPGYINWTVKNGQYAVQPPTAVLHDNYTLRIHLDDTDENNGALKVMPGTHKMGILRAENINPNNEIFCRVPAGGVMIMKPLLMHASERTVNNKNRRIIHIEISRTSLPEGLNWAEQKVLY